MPYTKNILIPGSDNRPVTLDIFFENDHQKKPVVIYAHGFNGFKDWGNFDLIAERFTREGFVMVKFNFSHNGTTPAHPEDFADLEAFGQNNYSKELADLHAVTDWVCDTANPYRKMIDIEQITLIGHSRGGGIAILFTTEDERIQKLVTWASVNECKTPWGNWPPEKMQEWKQTGVAWYTNSRTQQQMPMYYQLYEDFLQNEMRLNIRDAISRLQIPVLICHGTQDTAVPVAKAYELKEWQPNAELYILDSDHVFGRKHPWTENHLPAAMEAVVSKTLLFLKGEQSAHK
jgi:alpha-beta hydrolase superfamily lysophospholipase